MKYWIAYLNHEGKVVVIRQGEESKPGYAGYLAGKNSPIMIIADDIEAATKKAKELLHGKADQT